MCNKTFIQVLGLSLLLFTHRLNGQRVNIWYTPMNDTSADWNGTYTPISSNTNCPSPNDYCWQISTVAIVTRTISTAGYTNVELAYSMSTDNTINGTERCIIDYSVDGTNVYDIENVSTTNYDTTNTLTTWTTPTADNNSNGVTISLRYTGNSHNCYYNEFRLTGIPMDVQPATSNPTITAQPTSPSPTTAEPTTYCDTWTFSYCYLLDIYPSLTTDTAHTISIQNIDEGVGKNFEIYFTPQMHNCRNPSISFIFEDATTEYLKVYNAEGRWGTEYLLSTCTTQDKHCNNWLTCLNKYPLGISFIAASNTHRFTIYQPRAQEVNAFCSYSINANLTLHCGVVSPSTSEPTPGPISSWASGPTPGPISSSALGPTPGPISPKTSYASGWSWTSTTMIIVFSVIFFIVGWILCRQRRIINQQKAQIAQSNNDNAVQNSSGSGGVRNEHISQTKEGIYRPTDTTTTLSPGSGINDESPLPVGWRKVYTNTAQPYYQNDITKQSQWTRPVAKNNNNMETVHPPTAFNTVKIAERNNNENDLGLEESIDFNDDHDVHEKLINDDDDYGDVQME